MKNEKGLTTIGVILLLPLVVPIAAALSAGIMGLIGLQVGPLVGLL